MITIGIDFHKHSSTYHVLDDTGGSIAKCRLPNDPTVFVPYISGIGGEKRVAMEATRSWPLMYEAIRKYVDDFQLGHPKKMKALTESEFKNDKNDAQMVAQLAHMGFLPKAHVPEDTIRQLRDITHYRGFLVTQRKSIRNQIHTLVDRNVWPSEKPQSFKNLFCKKGFAWLSTLQLPVHQRTLLNTQLEEYGMLSKYIEAIEQYLKQQDNELPGLEHLRTVPGFHNSKVNAYCVLVETSEIARFRKARGYAHYCGLIPRERSSGDKQRMGKLISGANMHLRTAFIESTLAAIRADRGLKQYYQTVKERSGTSDAIIATARKLCYAVYHVLKEKRSYKPESVINPKTPTVAFVSKAANG